MDTIRSRRLFSSVTGCCLILLLAACSAATLPSTGSTGTASNSNSNVVNAHPAGNTSIVPTPTTTACPAVGTARAAVMPALTLGHHQNIVYIVNEGTSNAVSFGALKRYDVVTGRKTEIVQLAHTSIASAQVSADGQWVLFVAITAGQAKLQLVRMDGRFLQTLYCAPKAPNGADPTSALRDVQWSTNQRLIIFDSFTTSGAADYLLDVQHGHVQLEFSEIRKKFVYPPLTWLDNTRVYLLGPTIDGPSSALFILDTSRGGHQTPSNLQQVVDANAIAFCWNADSSFSGTQLFTSQCTTDPSTTGPGISAQHGPSKITVRPATGGSQQTIFTSPTMGITAIRSISKTTLLLLVENNGTGTNTSQNGLWRVNTNGSGLTRLTSDGAGVSGGPSLLCQYTQYPWSNVSRDGSMYVLQHNSGASTSTLLFGSLAGGAPKTFSSASNSTHMSIVGWTTM